ncbi:MAG TPA: beta-N-acetylglucosaminidase domain-containing protein [Candidatus Limnocylindria bacterium]
MSFAIRGLLEGFYDRLWTWAERERVADHAAELGFDTYVYAPKEDRLQNAGWRQPYPPDQVERLTAFAERCRGLGLAPWFGMRPVGFSYADAADAGRLADKLSAAVEMGAERILLLADDIPPTLEEGTAGRFARLEDAHAWLVEHALGVLDGGVPLAFCPTDYAGGGSPYLERLGALLPPEVDLCWTGAEVCSSRITASEAVEIGRVLRRPPLIWDNYPVNDAGMTRELHIGPIRDRDPELAGVTRGILVNAALQPEAGLVPLATWADYLQDPAGYDPEAAFERATLRAAGEDAVALRTIAAAFDRSAIRQGWERPEPAALEVALERLPRFSNRALAADLSALVGSQSAADDR